MGIERQILDWKQLKAKSQKIVRANKYFMNREDKKKFTSSYLDQVREYNLKYQTKFNLSRRPDG